MPVFTIADVTGQTTQGYDAMIAVLGPIIRGAPGFILHATFLVDGEWRVVEVWNSKEESDRFFAQVVAPNLPNGVRVKRKMHTLHSLVQSSDA